MPTADNDVYVPDENHQGAFEREIEMCELFRYHENNENVSVNFNVSSTGTTAWVHFDNAEDWSRDKGKFILHHLVKQFKLHMTGYKPEDIKVSEYPAADLEEKKKFVEYDISLDLNDFDIKVFSFDKEYLQYTSQYIF